MRHEVMLLASSLQQEDACWEQRVRCGKIYNFVSLLGYMLRVRTHSCVCGVVCVCICVFVCGEAMCVCGCVQ